MPFALPDPPPPPAPESSVELPPDLTLEIENSVKRFEQTWGTFSSMARSMGYVAKYRDELTAMVKLAYERGRTCSIS